MDIALEELNEAVKLDPDDARIYNLFGLVYAMLGENAKAEQNFQRALAMAPQDSTSATTGAGICAATGAPRESIPEFDDGARATRCTRRPRSSLINAVAAASRFGDSNGADNFFRRAQAAAPSNPQAIYGACADRVQAGPPGRGADVGPPPDAAAAGAARSALSRRCASRRRRGDRSAEQSYVSQLKNRYPDSGRNQRRYPPEYASDRA